MKRPRTNALSWKWGDHPWYPTSWVFDVLCAGAGTAAGLQVLVFAFLALTCFALSFACETAPWIVPGVALLLVPRLVPRPAVVRHKEAVAIGVEHGDHIFVLSGDFAHERGASRGHAV